MKVTTSTMTTADWHKVQCQSFINDPCARLAPAIRPSVRHSAFIHLPTSGYLQNFPFVKTVPDKP